MDLIAIDKQAKVLTPLGQECLKQLLQLWFKFERDLNRVPIIQRLERGVFDREDYQKLLMNLRQQVIEGARWITRGASSFDRDFADLRSVVIGHAADEHRDYEMLESDFVAAGGNLELIKNGTRNIGTEALHSYIMYRASQPNPVELIGAMWVIEGLGQKMANNWAERIDELIGTAAPCTKFMRYHGENDDAHLQKLYSLIDRVCKSDEVIARITKTAAVVSRLYILQLEEIDND